MNAHARDAMVTKYEQLIEAVELPDRDDRHVLAAAIKGRADLIVTLNLRHFPPEKVSRWGIEACHPDEFLTDLFQQSQSDFLQAVRTVRRRLKKPPRSVRDYLDTLRTHGLIATVDEIEKFDRLI